MGDSLVPPPAVPTPTPTPAAALATPREPSENEAEVGEAAAKASPLQTALAARSEGGRSPLMAALRCESAADKRARVPSAASRARPSSAPEERDLARIAPSAEGLALVSEAARAGRVQEMESSRHIQVAQAYLAACEAAACRAREGLAQATEAAQRVAAEEEACAREQEAARRREALAQHRRSLRCCASRTAP